MFPVSTPTLKGNINIYASYYMWNAALKKSCVDHSKSCVNDNSN